MTEVFYIGFGFGDGGYVSCAVGVGGTFEEEAEFGHGAPWARGGFAGEFEIETSDEVGVAALTFEVEVDWFDFGEAGVSHVCV